jgi:asparagine synthase (glutamine-hydrolysing)
MCGIAGSVQRRGPASSENVERQLRTIDHRGPDSWGVHLEGRAAIGQTRLAIIDLVTGDPPIATPDGRIGVALNGEIYNFAALRSQLLTRGHRLRTTGDTEVIAHLAEELEPLELARSLEGMFGFAVWDQHHERLILGRDRFGKKPLYYWRDADRFVFGSEIKTVLAHPAVVAELDDGAIPAYLHLGYVPSPRTFFRGIGSVPPGCVLVLDADMNVTVEHYWQLSAAGMAGTPRLDVDLPAATKLVREALSTAVADRLVADVPVGAFLSGGLDSSLIVALMAQHAAGRVRTFTIGFEPGSGFDERPWAAAAARHIGTEHTEFVVAPAAVELVDRIAWHFDQPFGDSSAIPTYLLAELTAGSVTVALAGDGGDELFAGYERFTAGRLVNAVPAPARRLGAVAASSPLLRGRGRAAKGRRFVAAAALGLPDALREWVAYAPWSQVEDLVPGASPWVLEDYRTIWARSAGAGVLDRLLLLNADTYLLDDLLPKVDRMSMAHALEVRSPFLDHRVAELALRLPSDVKATWRERKRVLRAVARGLVPDEVIDRPKKGFGVPLGQWFRGDLAAYVNDRVGGSDARVRRHLAGPVVDRLLGEHARGSHDHGELLWSLMMLEVFLRDRDW